RRERPLDGNGPSTGTAPRRERPLDGTGPSTGEEGLGTLRGVVLGPSKKAVASFVVQARRGRSAAETPSGEEPVGTRSREGWLARKTFKSKGGSFVYGDLPGGTYTVYVRASGVGSARIDKVSLRSGEKLSLGTIELKPRARRRARSSERRDDG
ncbi:MAG: carboxypeptidase-like regulatory domain-containing protein, partial [Planctomycetota bacterium]|nr:carboxypeptidase-like regulatory domain-containing protein [Planctomycetota bacterium]